MNTALQWSLHTHPSICSVVSSSRCLLSNRYTFHFDSVASMQNNELPYLIDGNKSLHGRDRITVMLL